ncbi:MAG TPA: LPS export ABC transporter periplasmic protein LptC, partial [Porticoccaceae bacterium]|nr:LPS export ABC transporter periplasmic protein LptC [Porticoccaceae bacterium]
MAVAVQGRRWRRTRGRGIYSASTGQIGNAARVIRLGCEFRRSRITMKNTLMAFFVAGILVIFILLLDSPPQVFTRNTETTPSGLPQASSYMINSETRKYDERGRLHLILTTERGQFFEAKKQFAMDAPIVVALDRDSRKPPWRLTAKTGTVFNNGDHIVFQGDVHARQSEVSGAS